jgi:DNA-binding winged helix-turn-helix (wHTH) protein
LTAPTGQDVALTSGEFDLLCAFARHPGRVLSRDFLLEETRGREAGPFDRTVDVQIGRLRRKLGGDAESDGTQLIKSVRGAGYILVPPVSASERMDDGSSSVPNEMPGIDEQTVFRTLFTASPDALIVADACGVIVLANSAAADLLGYPIDELVGLEVDALVPDAIRPRHGSYRAAYARNPRRGRWARRWSWWRSGATARR